MFDLEKYRTGETEVCCDSCGNTVDLNSTMAVRTIGRDRDGQPVTEQYFTCANCGRHYTIAVKDKKQHKMIQERLQLQRQIRIFVKIGARDRKIQKMQAQEERMKNAIMKRSAQLKEKWKEKCEVGNE